MSNVLNSNYIEKSFQIYPLHFAQILSPAQLMKPNLNINSRNLTINLKNCPNLISKIYFRFIPFPYFMSPFCFKFGLSFKLILFGLNPNPSFFISIPTIHSKKTLKAFLSLFGRSPCSSLFFHFSCFFLSYFLSFSLFSLEPHTILPLSLLPSNHVARQTSIVVCQPLAPVTSNHSPPPPFSYHPSLFLSSFSAFFFPYFFFFSLTTIPFPLSLSLFPTSSPLPTTANYIIGHQTPPTSLPYSD